MKHERLYFLAAQDYYRLKLKLCHDFLSLRLDNSFAGKTRSRLAIFSNTTSNPITTINWFSPFLTRIKSSGWNRDSEFQYLLTSHLKCIFEFYNSSIWNRFLQNGLLLSKHSKMRSRIDFDVYFKRFSMLFVPSSSESIDRVVSSDLELTSIVSSIMSRAEISCFKFILIFLFAVKIWVMHCTDSCLFVVVILLCGSSTVYCLKLLLYLK